MTLLGFWRWLVRQDPAYRHRVLIDPTCDRRLLGGGHQGSVEEAGHRPMSDRKSSKPLIGIKGLPGKKP